MLTPFGGHEYSSASAVAVQADGRIVVAGSSGTSLGGPTHFALARYTTSGKLDTSFGSGGRVLTAFGGKRSDRASAVAMQTDGRIVVAGESDSKYTCPHNCPIEGFDLALTRYTTSGKLDASFGVGGKVLSDLRTKSGDWASAVAIHRDGKTVAAGLSDANGERGYALVRYTGIRPCSAYHRTTDGSVG